MISDAPGASPRGSSALRRLCLTILIVGSSAWAVETFSTILAIDGLTTLDVAHIAVFVPLVVWLAQSFWTLTAGFLVLWGRLMRGGTGIPTVMAAPRGRTAIIMPIYNEDTRHAFARVAAIWEDLIAVADDAGRFDAYVISDTTDPDVWLAEEAAWEHIAARASHGERLFYRRRTRNFRRKVGNVQSFLEQWGGYYETIVVLDADSLMAGSTIAELARRMDAAPDVALIQAPPKLVRGTTVFARILQFAGELYGPLSASGLSYWALGEGNYWGHNAIIRVDPFMKLCGLPALAGRKPFGGDILSHDFVEAALLRRGGYRVLIADDLGGSYEEAPPTVGGFIARDRRWAQGNLQHLRVLLARRLHWVSRLHMGIGVMAYVTSPLWLVFMLLAAAQGFQLAHGQPVYFIEGLLFPRLPISVTAEATTLLVVTLGFLFVPKLWGLLLAMADAPRRRALGGGYRVLAGVLIETLLSAMLAPIMMIYHTVFVVTIAVGAGVEWNPQQRAGRRPKLRDSMRAFGPILLIGVAATVAAVMLAEPIAPWLAPVLAGFLLAPFLVRLLDDPAIGRQLRRLRLLNVREEKEPPAVFGRLASWGPSLLQATNLSPFVRVLIEPGAYRRHLESMRASAIVDDPVDDPWQLSDLERKAIYVGPNALTREERRALLEDPGAFRRVHLAIWAKWPEEKLEAILQRTPRVA